MSIDKIATDNPFSRRETETLATLVGMMIPASATYNVPGADDPAILTSILETVGEQPEVFENGLRAIDASSAAGHDAEFPSLDHAARMAIVEESRHSSSFLRELTLVVAQCYYRDARVMESLGMEARAPYPKGFELPQGDWSLLDPVRARGKIWRDVNT